MKGEENINAYTVKTPAERDKVLLNPSESASTSVSETATMHTKNNISCSCWSGVHVLNQKALQGVL